MEEKSKYACWLYSVPGIGNKTMEKLLALCPDEEQIYSAGEKLWRRVLTARQLEQIKLFRQHTEPEALYQELLAGKIRFVMRSDKDYPRRLAQIPDPPYALFVKGRLPGEAPSAAVVGARECSEYGRFVASGIGRALAESGVQVISGMARGIDGISQSAALEAGGSSFGVLGSGVDVCYPASNRALYERLCEQGGILSAYPLKTQARPQHFPPRNRIVSGLADALIVVEARHRSGTLITVDMALEQGKEVYVVPGRVTDRLSDGCNYLIKQGAGVFLSPEDFLRELWESHGTERGGGRESRGTECSGERESRGTERAGERGSHGTECDRERESRGTERGRDEGRLAPTYRTVCEVLDFQPLNLEQIQGRIPEKYSLPQLMTILMELCMEGLASQVSPGHFVRKA